LTKTVLNRIFRNTRVSFHFTSKYTT